MKEPSGESDHLDSTEKQVEEKGKKSDKKDAVGYTYMLTTPEYYDEYKEWRPVPVKIGIADKLSTWVS